MTSPDWIRLSVLTTRIKDLEARAADAHRDGGVSPLSMLYSELADLHAEHARLVGRMLEDTARMEADRVALANAFSSGSGGVVRADSIESPKLRCLMTYWEELRHGSMLPRKQDFNPMSLPIDVWPHLFLIDVAGETYRVHLMGAYVVDSLGKDFTGRRLTDDDIPGISGSVTYRLVREAVNARAVRHFIGHPTFGPADHFIQHEQIVLPLRDEAGQVCAGVGAISYSASSSVASGVAPAASPESGTAAAPHH